MSARQMPLHEATELTVAGDGCTYLGWFDPDPKRTTLDKAAAALDRFQRKFGIFPNVCLVNDETARALPPSVAGMRIEAMRSVPRQTFYVGREGA